LFSRHLIFRGSIILSVIMFIIFLYVLSEILLPPRAGLSGYLE